MEENMPDANSRKKKKELSKFPKELILTIIAGLFVLLAAWVGKETYNKKEKEKEKGLQPLVLEGWATWGGIIASSNDNTITVNGTINQAGCYTTFVNTTMRNKKITLKITNAANSRFDNDAMLKITANELEILINPLNVPSLIYGEYVPSWYNEIEFIMPMNFDGKLGFVFTRAKLNNLQINLFYRE